MNFDIAKQHFYNKKYKEASLIFQELYVSKPFTNEQKTMFASCINKTKDEQGYTQLQFALRLATQVFKEEPTNKKNKNLLMWISYNLYVSEKSPIFTQSYMTRAANFICEQTKIEEYSPYERTIMEVLKFYKNKEGNHDEDILYWCEKVFNPYQLSPEPFIILDKYGKNMEISSNLEKWFDSIINATYNLNQFQRCIDLIEEVMGEKNTLNTPFKLHNGRDIWFPRKKAQCYIALERWDEANTVLKELEIKSDNPFVLYDLMLVNLYLGNDGEAKVLGARALLHKQGTKEHKIKIFYLMGHVLEIMDDKEAAYAHYLFTQKIRTDNKWKIDKKLNETLQKLDEEGVNNKSYSSKAFQSLWTDIIESNYPKCQGTIMKLLSEGRTGFIQDNNNGNVFFRTVEAKGHIDVGSNVSYLLRPSFDKRKNRPSLEAIRIQVINKENTL